MGRRSNKKPDVLDRERNEREEALKSRQDFEQMVLDGRRYRSLKMETLQQMVRLASAGIEKNKAAEIERLEEEQARNAERLKELRGK